jgi:hypothetical protein
MAIRAYLSNIHPFWPFDRQERLLAEALPGFPAGVEVLRDELDAKARRANIPDSLVSRSIVIRPTTRQRKDDIYIASPAVLDWSVDGLLSALASAISRGATVHMVDCGITVGPDSGPAGLLPAIEAFRAARKSRDAQFGGLKGGQVSGLKRSAEKKAAAMLIEFEWGEPSSIWHTDALCAWVGISRNTANLYLRKRPVAQRERASQDHMAVGQITRRERERAAAELTPLIEKKPVRKHKTRRRIKR